MQVHRTCSLPCAELIGVGERILQQLHDGDDAAALVLDLLDRCAVLTDIAQQQRHATAPLGQLQCRVDRTPDRLHVVLDPQEEARNRLAALLLARVEEGRCRRLEPTRDDLVDKLARQTLIAGGQRHRHHADAVLEALEVALSVESLQRIARVVLERPEESREPELLGVRVTKELLHEIATVAFEHLGLVVVLRDQVVQLLVEVVEEDGVLVDVLQKVLVRGLPVLLELNLPVGVVQIEHRVERVVIQLARIVPRRTRVDTRLAGRCGF